MVAINFPDTPTVDQTFTSGDKTWKWTGSVWEIVATPTVPVTSGSGISEFLLMGA